MADKYLFSKFIVEIVVLLTWRVTQIAAFDLDFVLLHSISKPQLEHVNPFVIECLLVINDLGYWSGF